MPRTRTGQSAVEFALVIGIFLFLLLAVLEVSRVIYERQVLARAAEVIVKELAETNPNKVPINSATGLPDTPYVISVSDVQTAIADANRQANLGLSTTWPLSGGTTQAIANLPGGDLDAPNNTFDSSTGTCHISSSSNPECQAAPNQGGTVELVGYNDLNGPYSIAVTVSQPYNSFLFFPLQFLDGKSLSETVSATPLWYQQQP